MSATFLKGTKSGFFKAMGIPYGEIIVEGCDPFVVFQMDPGGELLGKGVKEGLLTADEAGEVGDAMRTAGLAENFPALIERVRQTASMKESVDCSATQFEMCGCDMPHAHGYVKKVGNDYWAGPIFTLEQGFFLCAAFADGKGEEDSAEAEQVFRQMLATNLPLDDGEKGRRYAALPEDVRARHEAEVEDLAGGHDLDRLLAVLFSR